MNLCGFVHGGYYSQATIRAKAIQSKIKTNKKTTKNIPSGNVELWWISILSRLFSDSFAKSCLTGSL